MRVLFTNAAPVIKYGLARGFEELGHPVFVHEGDHRLFGMPPELQRERLVSALESFRPDLVVTEGFPGIDLGLVTDVVRRHRIFHVYWAIEDPPLWELSRTVAERCDFTFTTAEECVARYRACGIRAALLPFACWPGIHRRVDPDPSRTCDAVLVANRYDQFPHRQEGVRTILLPLLEAGLDVHVYGRGWDAPGSPLGGDGRFRGSLRGPLPYEEIPCVYASARIVLGIHSVGNSRTQTAMRTFEALGCGAFYLTQKTPAHGHLFVPGRHLVWSESPRETVALARHYLDHPDSRCNVAMAGQAEVYARHTYRHRAESVLATLGPYLR